MKDYDEIDVGDKGFDTPEYRDNATRNAGEYERSGRPIMAQHWRDCRALSWDKQHSTKTHRWSA